ncbi:histone-lysine N-methyltransferase SETMAR [Trichonephila clavipes]|uniref:Histone-lysine N-methyltransferase SETMAR n=1 Tax=Trichonephila clavipes TaxID=2585209 RepID=A0A8X6VDL0_TRICX|nr:histone-lysine N-methyltransferase SETMAR [Trichonephila clavipes]
MLVRVYEDQALSMKCVYEWFIRIRERHGSVSDTPVDCNPPDFFMFSRFKLALKGKRFDDISDIQRNVTRLLNSTSKEDFLQSFQDMYSRSQQCIVMGCDYFEGQYGNFS